MNAECGWGGAFVTLVQPLPQSVVRNISGHVPVTWSLLLARVSHDAMTFEVDTAALADAGAAAAPVRPVAAAFWGWVGAGGCGQSSGASAGFGPRRSHSWSSNMSSASASPASPLMTVLLRCALRSAHAAYAQPRAAAGFARPRTAVFHFGIFGI